MPTTYEQPVLFGDPGLHQERSDEAAVERAAWASRFERAPWTAPYDTSSGTPAGMTVLGYRCPDPECGRVEVNGFVLSINHGFDPDVPGRQPWDGRCRLVTRDTAGADTDSDHPIRQEGA